MRERRQSALAACCTVARARRARAMVQHAADVRRETAAGAAASMARNALAGAGAAWHCAVEGAFDPMMCGLFAHAVVERADEAEAAAHRHVADTSARTRSAARWREDDAICRALDERVAKARRVAAAKAEERHLAILADRLTYAWLRR